MRMTTPASSRLRADAFLTTRWTRVRLAKAGKSAQLKPD